MRKYLLLFIVLFRAISGFTQPGIISVVPSTVLKGQQINIIIKGENTHFVQSETSIDFGQGISVKSVSVSGPTILTAVIQVDAAATTGSRKLVVQTSQEFVEMDDALEVIETGNEVRAVISLMPVQALYLADFDPNNIKSAPLIFNVLIINDQQIRNLKSKLTISHGEYGEIIRAEKSHPAVQPGKTISYNNREFDEYNVNNSADKLLKLAAQTGMLPPGTYTYKIEVFNDAGDLLAEDEISDELTNDITNIELIGPGEGLDFSPEVIFTEFPYFQWFSQAFSYDFTLYEVLQGQSSKDEILSNVPIFQQKNISATSLIYPSSAEKLLPNKAYAWQVKAYFTTATGQKEIISDVYWFTIGGSDKSHLKIQRIEVEPEMINISTGETHQFTAYGYDDKGEKIKMMATWKIIPSDGGSISQNGLFKAGKYPKPVAVLAEYEGISGYSTVNILWNINNQYFDIGQLIDDIFGLPQK